MCILTWFIGPKNIERQQEIRHGQAAEQWESTNNDRDLREPALDITSSLKGTSTDPTWVVFHSVFTPFI
jgi:hypothetical protein